MEKKSEQRAVWRRAYKPVSEGALAFVYLAEEGEKFEENTIPPTAHQIC